MDYIAAAPDGNAKRECEDFLRENGFSPSP